jgi:alkylation response protein AidB-like acyl-CoA dehydrogenase
MFLEETTEQILLREELRAYFQKLITTEVRAAMGPDREHGPLWRSLVEQMGSDGWLGIGWPNEYGGQGRAAAEQLVFLEEVDRAGAPFPFVTLSTVGPTLMRYGTDQQKKHFLPGILAGKINFAIGYTEPEAGTDLASLRTTATRDGDEYVINGNKVFTSGAFQADYVWLAARTDPTLPKHKGISIFAVPTSSAGFSWTPIVTVPGTVTTATFYDEVRVPVSARVGRENDGWQMMTAQLNHERIGLAANGFGAACWFFEEVSEWAASDRRPDGTVVLEEPWVQAALARVHALLEAMRLLNWRMTSQLDAGNLNPADASAVKVYGTEARVEVYRALLEVLGPLGRLRTGASGVIARGALEREARWGPIGVFGGGVNDVQREIIATVGLGMPRQARRSPS